MAIDLQVIYPQDSIQLSKVSFLPGYAPPSLIAEGSDFSTVSEVWVNDTQSARWVAIRRKVLIVQIPDAQVGQPITSVEVLSNRLTIGPQSRLIFQIGGAGRRVAGIMRLVQLYVKVLLTTPGTDIFSPQTGGSLLTKTGQQVSLHDGGRDVIGDLVMSCNSATKQITAIQAKDPALPPVERLLSANVDNAVFDRNILGVKTNIRIISHSGVVGYANMLL